MVAYSYEHAWSFPLLLLRHMFSHLFILRHMFSHPICFGFKVIAITPPNPNPPPALTRLGADLVLSECFAWVLVLSAHRRSFLHWLWDLWLNDNMTLVKKRTPDYTSFAVRVYFSTTAKRSFLLVFPPAQHLSCYTHEHYSLLQILWLYPSLHFLVQNENEKQYVWLDPDSRSLLEPHMPSYLQNTGLGFHLHHQFLSQHHVATWLLW